MKIRIFGGIASGKSSLAKYLSKHLNIPAYCTDDFVYTHFGNRRSEPDRVRLIKKTLRSSWIVEGVHFADWVKYTYLNADIIIIIKKSKFVLAKRIIARTLNEERSHYKSKFLDIFWMMLRDTSKEMKEYTKIAKEHDKKLILVTDDEYAEVLKEIKKCGVQDLNLRKH